MTIKQLKLLSTGVMMVWGVFIMVDSLYTQPVRSPHGYNIYSGSTHAHSIYTISHGAHWTRIPGHKRYMYVDSQNVSHAQNTELKSDWEKHQGLPADHFAAARASGNYDFYVCTDHSQETGFRPTSEISSAWISSIRQAEEASGRNFLALVGYEHSENNGPVGRGHINVINSATYLNALAPGVDIPFLYQWLETVQANGEGSVVATFNHPGKSSYDDWNHGNDKVRDIITMLEVINSNKRIHYEGFVSALDKGWKVSPVCGNDNHGLDGIRSNTSRTFVLAEDRSKTGILGAMKNRRTYAALEENLQASYTVNNVIMGSILEKPSVFQFDIFVADPDINDPEDKITRIDIVTDNGTSIMSYTPPVSKHSIQWNPVIRNTESSYFFVRVWNAGGGDAPRPDSSSPIAWLAPVWTGR